MHTRLQGYVLCRSAYFPAVLFDFLTSPLKLCLSGSVLTIPECASLSWINIFRKKRNALQFTCSLNVHLTWNIHSTVILCYLGYCEIYTCLFIDFKTFCLLVASWFLYFSHIFSKNSLKLNTKNFIKHWKFNFSLVFSLTWYFISKRRMKISNHLKSRSLMCQSSNRVWHCF